MPEKTEVKKRSTKKVTKKTTTKRTAKGERPVAEDDDATTPTPGLG